MSVSNGRVTLQGSVLEQDLDDLLRAVGRVAGVSDVVNELEAHREPGSVPPLQGGRSRETTG